MDEREEQCNKKREEKNKGKIRRKTRYTYKRSRKEKTIRDKQIRDQENTKAKRIKSSEKEEIRKKIKG